MPTATHEVLIIGAGPAGLAVAARLREQTPSAVFTDAEHSRYQWIKKHAGRMNIHRMAAIHRPGAKHPSTPCHGTCEGLQARSSTAKALEKSP